MADIVILPGSIDIGESVMNISGVCYTSDQEVPSDAIFWATSVAWNASVSTINTAVKNAAVAAAQVAGHTVGALDNKTVLGGAVGLL